MRTLLRRLTWCRVPLVGVDAVDGGAAHVPRQVDVDGRHDAQDEAGLQDSDKVLSALALVAGHELLAVLGEEDVDVREEGPEDSADHAHQDGGKDGDDVDSHQVLGRELGLEQPEVVLVLEAVEGRVEQVCREGGRHAAEEDLPRQLVLPEGGHLLHGEQQPAHWGTEGRRDAGCRAGRDEVSPVLRIPEAGEAGQAALEGGRLELAHAGRHQASEVDHGSLVADWHAAADGKRARQELDDEGLNLEDVLDPGAVQEPDDLGYPGPRSRGLVDHQE